ncbi:MAG TPA: hypothetical protein ENN18_05775 [Proteobacteria bacterium]|nr:hypothetical protein [Pseudomonadota bacterium]
MEQLSLLDLKAKPCPDPEEPKKNSESLSCLFCRPTSNPPVQDDPSLAPKPRGFIPIDEIWKKTPLDIQAEWDEAVVHMEEVRKRTEAEIDELKKELERLKSARDHAASVRKKTLKSRIEALRRKYSGIAAEYEEKGMVFWGELSQEAIEKAKRAGIEEYYIDDFILDFTSQASPDRPYIESNYNKTIQRIFDECILDFLPQETRPGKTPKRPFPCRTGRQLLLERSKRHEAKKEGHTDGGPPKEPISIISPNLLQSASKTIQTVTKHFERLYHITHSWSSFGDAVALMEATLDRFSPGGEERYLEYAKRLGREGCDEAAKIFAILLDHFTYGQNFEDILGPAYMNLAGMGAKSFLGQFFTPWNVALMMAAMAMGERPDEDPEGPIKIYDPACGSGVMLLAGKAVAAGRHGREALRRYRFYGTDIDPICANMCRIQMKMTDDFFMTNFLLASIPDILAATGNPLQPQGVHFPGQDVRNVEASPGRHQMPS